MNGFLNAATASGLMAKQRRLARDILDGNMCKSDKQAALLTISSIRKQLSQDDLPSYNTEEFRTALQALANEGDRT